MLTDFVSQGGSNQKASFSTLLQELSLGQDFDRLDVAIAYATVAGVKTLEKAIGGIPAVSRWVIGLDDAITQPKAILDLMELPGTEVRLISLADEGRRFHPKIYSLWSTDVETSALLVLGSGNMTQAGMRKNGEAGIVIRAETTAEVKDLLSVWEEFWDLGYPATNEIVEEYSAKYKAARKARKKIEKLGAAPPEPKADELVLEDFEPNGDPTSSIFAWLDAGSATAQGRELELPRAMTAYFGVTSTSDSPIDLQIRQGNRSDQLKLTMREDNAMWRIGFPSPTIEAGTGRQTLRPVTGGNRSDLAVLFRKLNENDYEIEFVPLNSEKYQSMMALSESVDSLFRTMKTTSGRQFGFY